MRSIIKYGVTTWLLLLLGSAMLMAASPDDEDFNPSNPPEPNSKFKVEVRSPEYTYCSGSGSYGQGETVYIYTSAGNENYQFAYWKKDGEKYSDQYYFQYVMTDRSVVFEAVYNYVPVNPADPSPMNKYRLYLTTDDSENCAFNYNSGAKIEAGESVYLCAYLSQGFVFKGWYKGEELVSSSSGFYYTMPAEDTRLTARVLYSPDSPSDPNSTEKDDSSKPDEGGKEDTKPDDSGKEDTKPDEGDKEDTKPDDSGKEDTKPDEGDKEDETTSIEQILSDPNSATQIYLLDGTKVSAVTKSGIYIINHKKVAISK